MPAELVAAVNAVHQMCSNGNAYLDEAMVKAMSTATASNDEAVKEHLFCMSKKIGLQDENGELNVDVVKKNVGMIFAGDTEKANIFLSKCKPTTGTPADKAREVLQCFLDLYK